VSDTPPARLAGRGEEVLHALASRPGGPQLLRLCEQREDIQLVGGAVRDLLLARQPRELDVVVAADASALARELADALGARVSAHPRFGTALVQWEQGRIDIAQRRAESYAAPGALPDVRPGSIAEDLQRRDFTVNAIAVALAGADRGTIYSAEHAPEDLASGRLRVLHDQSFREDPTRLWRLARYQARLGFQPEPHTAELASAAVAAGALATVSRPRIGAELRLALSEADAPAALQAIDALALLAALHPRLRFDAQLAQHALDVLAVADAAGTRPPREDLLMLATLLAPAVAGEERVGADGELESELYALLNDLEFPAGDRDLAIYEAMCVEDASQRLARARTPSQIYEAASHMSPEGVALAGAWGEQHARQPGAGQAAREWLSELDGVTLLINGEDLLAAGVPQGPEIRRRLEAALLSKLDGELGEGGREAELSAALEAFPSGDDAV
jgi:tRNA nucleotidyltransferase (CCA-adding enzyme)